MSLVKEPKFPSKKELDKMSIADIQKRIAKLDKAIAESEKKKKKKTK